MNRSIYTIIPGYENSGRTVRVIDRDTDGDNYLVEDVLDEEIFKIHKKQVEGKDANKRPDPYRHHDLHAILQIPSFEGMMKGQFTLRNNEILTREMLRIDPGTRVPVSWEKERTFYIFRSLLQKARPVESGSILCVVADQNIEKVELRKLKEYMEIDQETFPQKFIRLGIFRDKAYGPGEHIYLNMYMGEDENSIVATDMVDRRQRVYSILARKTFANGVQIWEMDRLFIEIPL